MNNIYFYIIVPVYNVECFLKRCLESCINQSYSFFSIVCIDDGSKDNSCAILDEYKSKYDFIHVVHQENNGVFQARKTGLKFASSLMLTKKQNEENIYIIYVDSDDYLCTNALETLNNYINQTNCDIILFGWNRVKNNKIISSTKDKYRFLTNQKDIINLIINNPSMNSLCRKCHKISLVDYSIFDTSPKIKYAEDLLQSFSILENSKNLLIVPDNLYNYQYNYNSATNNLKNVINDFQTNYVRLYIYDNITKKKLLNEQKMNNYLFNQKSLLIEKLWIITRYPCSKKEKHKIFDILRNDEYWNMLLQSISFSHFPLKYFQSKHYFCLKFYLYIWKIITKLKIIKYKKE